MDAKSDLALRIDRGKFKDFVTSLLGQRRTIEREFGGGHFAVDHAWLENLFRVCEQRLAQHEYTLTDFKADFYFRGGRVYKVESHEAFLAYTDISTEESVGVDLRWAYLIFFPGVPTPEKQELRLEVFSHYKIKEKVESDKRTAVIKYSVGFTNLTWGEDISRHLNAYIEQHRENGIVERCLEYLWESPTAFFTTIVIAFSSSMYFVGFPSLGTQTFKEDFLALAGRTDLESIAKKVDILGRYWLYPRDEKLGWFFAPFLIVVAISLVVFFGVRFLPALYPSFVILNKATEEKARRAKTRREYLKWSVYVALIVGVLASFFAARLDRYLFPNS